MIALPVSGLPPFFGGVTQLGSLQGGILKALLWALIGLHLVAALYHHLI